jgi:hypothetical protein
LANPTSPTAEQDRPVPLHGIRIALCVALLAGCAYWLLAFISDKQWHALHPGAMPSGVPDPLAILWFALPLLLYAVSGLLLSTRSEDLIIAGAGMAAGLAPPAALLAVATLLGSMFFSFYPEPYFLPMAISLVALFAGSAWTLVSAFRMGKANWGVFLPAGGGTFICVAICVTKGMNS